MFATLKPEKKVEANKRSAYSEEKYLSLKK